ncbi:zinc knuckle CX2CX4HX4C containing protein [Tanacetum coccineum]
MDATGLVKGSSSKKAVRIKEMRNSEVVAGARVAIPLEAVEEVRSRFANTLYGYFIGKRLAFPLVENYVKNTWAKFGLKRIMLDGDFFLFQFESKEGMNKVIESGPWLIKLVPLILNIWTPNTVLKKEEVKHAPVWVKLYNVPVVAYSEVGLSLITTQIGKPIMLDSYTSSICMTSWGKKEYARALIEVSAEEILLESMVIAIPFGDGTGHSLATIDIEYEWRPPRCDNCRIFDHTNESCPKNPKVAEASKENNDGFTEVKKKKKGKAKQRQVEGIRFSKSPLNLKYRKIDKGNSSKPDENMEQPKKMKPKDPIVTISNSFNALDENKDEEKDDEFWGSKEQWINSTVLNESDSDNEEMILEDKDEKRTTEGASTPVLTVPHD